MEIYDVAGDDTKIVQRACCCNEEIWLAIGVPLFPPLFDHLPPNENHVYEGAKLFRSGNQLCKFNKADETLTLTVPPCLVDKYGLTVTLHGVNFNYGREWLNEALTPTKYPDGKPKSGKQKYRTGAKQPVTYELVRRDNRWYINAIIDQPN